MTLNEKIGEILKEHKEGEKFFDALDYMIRGDKDILKDFYEFAIDNIFINNSISTTTYNLIVSGKFGMALLTNYRYNLNANFNKVIVTNGNIRKGELPEIYCNELNKKPFIFLDDSFYSGKTKDSIEKALKEINPNSKIVKTIVVYDGSINNKENIISMYRYHK